MNFLIAFLIVVLVLCGLMLIGLVLLQKSKSEGLGLAFGAGAGESLFGARAGNVLSKATVVLGCVFMACALALGSLFARGDVDRKSLMDDVQSDSAPMSEAQTSPLGDLNLETPATATEPAAE